MKRKNIVSGLLLLFFIIWFFQYFLSYIQGAYTIVVFLFGLGLWFVILGMALYQIIKLLFEEPKHYQRLLYACIMLILNILSLAKPSGLIDWEKYEGENLLVAEREGTAHCTSIIKLKHNNKFKFVNRCFGVDFHWGSYYVSNDTIHLQLKSNVGYIDKEGYATLLKSQNDSTKYSVILLH